MSALWRQRMPFGVREGTQGPFLHEVRSAYSVSGHTLWSGGPIHSCEDGIVLVSQRGSRTLNSPNCIGRTRAAGLRLVALVLDRQVIALSRFGQAAHRVRRRV